MGITHYFDVIVVSADHGFRKPDRRLFQYALDGMGVAAENTMYIGNDMHRDIYGAREAGMRTVMYDSAARRTKEYEGVRPRPHHHRLARAARPAGPSLLSQR